MKIALIVLSVFLIALVSANVVLPVHKKPGRYNSPPDAFTKAKMAAGHPVKLGGNIYNYGEFYVPFYLGTPGQFFDAQIDTGSSDLLINAVGCQGCGSGRKFDISKSRTAQKISCTDSNFQCGSCFGSSCAFDDQYGDGSEVSGYVLQDNLSWGSGSGIGNSSIFFGATQQSTPNFEPTGVDGIFGLAYRGLSSWGGVPPFERMVSALGIPNVYSMCLTPSGASMTLGATVPSSVQWTSVTKKLWFVVQMDDFKVGTASLGYKSSAYADAIVDSGTTLLLLPDAPFATLAAKMRAMCSSVNLVGVCNVASGQSLFDGQCYKMSQSQINQFPSMSIKLAGVDELHISAADYLLDQQGYKCLGIQSSGGSGTIMGDVFMQHFHTFFDMGSNRVGFAPLTTCPQV